MTSRSSNASRPSSGHSHVAASGLGRWRPWGDLKVMDHACLCVLHGAMRTGENLWTKVLGTILAAYPTDGNMKACVDTHLNPRLATLGMRQIKTNADTKKVYAAAMDGTQVESFVEDLHRGLVEEEPDVEPDSYGLTASKSLFLRGVAKTFENRKAVHQPTIGSAFARAAMEDGQCGDCDEDDGDITVDENVHVFDGSLIGIVLEIVLGGVLLVGRRRRGFAQRAALLVGVIVVASATRLMSAPSICAPQSVAAA